MQGQDPNAHHLSQNAIFCGQKNTLQTWGIQQGCFGNVGRGRSRKDQWKVVFVALWSEQPWMAEAWLDRKSHLSEVWVEMHDIFTCFKIDNTFFWSPLVWNYFKQNQKKSIPRMTVNMENSVYKGKVN